MTSLFVTLVIIAISILVTRWVLRIDKIVNLLENIVVLLEKNSGSVPVKKKNMCPTCGFIQEEQFWGPSKCPRCGT